MRDGAFDHLVRQFASLPGIGKRSAQRIVLSLLTGKSGAIERLSDALIRAGDSIKPCSACGNLDETDPCYICTNPNRQKPVLCVIAGVGDLWAIERGGSFSGRYHTLGGVLSAMDSIGPGDLRIDSLLKRVQEEQIEEVILALGATVDGQTTAHYIADRLRPLGVKMTRLAHGLPVGGELDYLDDGTISMALRARSAIGD